MENITDNIKKYNTLQIRDLLNILINKWYWFTLSFILFIGATVFYIQRTSPKYLRSASILVKDETKGGNIGAAADVIADLGFFQSKVNIQNELLIIQAPIIIQETVKRLQLNETYKIKQGIRFYDLYQKAPISVSLPEKSENDYISYIINIISDKEFEITETWLNGDHISNEIVRGRFGSSLSTDVGHINITTRQDIHQYIGKAIYYSNIPVIIASNRLSSQVKFELGNKMATIIDISIQDASIKRGDDILNTIIRIYGEEWIKDKNQIAESTSEFITDRLALIEKDLGNVDNDISTYKSENLLPDAQAVSNKYLERSNKNDAQILELSTQYSMATYIQNFMQKASRKEQLIPANSGIDNKIEKQINEYNTLLLERNRMLGNSSNNNPLIMDMNQSLKSMRETILSSIGDLLEIIDIQLDKVYQSESVNKKKISQTPTQVKYLLSVERQQKIKEALYLFLLQKREENELTYAFTAYNTRVISPPMGNLIPISPNKIKLILIAMILGFIIPCIILLIKESLNTSIMSRKDLQSLAIPIIGEIPWGSKKPRIPFKKKRKQLKNKITIVVNNKSRNHINEAFRIVRTNIDFMLEDNRKGSVMMVTSINPDSGKTFIAANLAISMGIKGSKILVIDLDLRKASISSIVNNPKIGVSDYLAGKQKNIQDLIVKCNNYENLDILPVGKIPPNPSELLSSHKLKDLISELKMMYDYIVLDCTPIDIVADASIVNKVSDSTIFIIRAGLFDRKDVPYIQDLYNEKKYNNIRLVLNNSDIYGKYGYEKYGYGRYGYNKYTYEI